MRIVIELKKDVYPQVILNTLYKHTSMQETFGANMLALVNGQPKILSLRDMVYYYLEHQKDVVTRRTRFDLNKEAKAMHSRQEVSIISRLVRVTQPNLIGQNIADCKLLDGLHCMVTRVVRNDRLMPLTPEDTFREGTEVLIVGNSDTMPHDIAFLGEVCDNPYPMDSQKERRKLILTNKNYACSFFYSFIGICFFSACSSICLIFRSIFQVIAVFCTFSSVCNCVTSRCNRLSFMSFVLPA